MALWNFLGSWLQQKASLKNRSSGHIKGSSDEIGGSGVGSTSGLAPVRPPRNSAPLKMRRPPVYSMSSVTGISDPVPPIVDGTGARAGAGAGAEAAGAAEGGGTPRRLSR